MHFWQLDRFQARIEFIICLYDNWMSFEKLIEFDPVKDVKNLAKHKVSLGKAQDFDWENAQIHEDLRRPYPERRFKARATIEECLHELVHCLREGSVRVISLRKSNRREIKIYENQNEIR
jgi:uncharacterized protein